MSGVADYIDELQAHRLVDTGEWPLTYFAPGEFVCSCCGTLRLHMPTAQKLDTLREAMGRPIRVNSGYRCPDHNARISSTGRNGPHTTGHAFDLALSGDLRAALSVAIDLGFSGFGLNQRGDYAGRFVHLDTLPADQGQPRPHFWTY